MKTRQNLLAALEESEARYRHLVESASDGIYRINVPGYFLYANPIASRVLGGGEASIVGRHYLEFVRADFHDGIQQVYARQIRDHTPVTYYEFPAISLDGKALWIGQRVHLELDERNNVVALHAVARDITDRKRLEDELRQADKMRVVGQLAGGVAHDFNTILASITAAADSLAQQLGSEDLRMRLVQDIRKSVGTGERLTSQLLTFSRRDLFRPKVLNVNDVIEMLRPMLAQIFGASIKIQTVLDPTLGNVRADEAQIEQIIINLALNARDAMPAGGSFTLRTDNVSVGTDVADATMYPGSYVVLTVTDTGAGMDEVVKEKIFEPFFSTKGAGHGHGLGLSTTFGIVNQAAGRIMVESAPGSGTTFRIYLPRIRTGSSVSPTPPRSVPIEHRGGVVLVADDEDGVRNVLTRLLEANGYRVISATNGVDALKKARAYSGAIDLLLADLVMPQMGGFELAEAFSTERPASQVLFMSGYVDQQGLDYRIGNTVRLLHKPFDSETVLTEVKSLMPLSRRSEQRASL